MATTPFAIASEVKATNPTGRIAVLICDDGRALCDSRGITRYRDARVRAGLYPEA